MQEIRCIFCKNSHSEIAIEENGYTGRRCNDCGLIYISPRPSRQEIVDIYGHDDANISAQKHIKDEFGKRLVARHSLKIIRKFSKGRAILEIGSGAGFFLDEAKKSGFEPFGIELNKIQAEFINNKLQLSCESEPLGADSFGGRSFDVIYHSDVISHFFDPIEEFKMMNQRLGDNGLIVFETGNIADVQEKYFKYINSFQYPDHLFFFGEKTIARLLEMTGFELLKVYRYNVLPQVAEVKFVNRLKKLIFRKSTAAAKSVDGPNQSEKSSAKAVHRKLSDWLVFFQRYKLGRILPKKAMPQTIIFIGRKTKGQL